MLCWNQKWRFCHPALFLFFCQFISQLSMPCILPSLFFAYAIHHPTFISAVFSNFLFSAVLRVTNPSRSIERYTYGRIILPLSFFHARLTAHARTIHLLTTIHPIASIVHFFFHVHVSSRAFLFCFFNITTFYDSINMYKATRRWACALSCHIESGVSS